jgi:hypothetical protein
MTGDTAGDEHTKRPPQASTIEAGERTLLPKLYLRGTRCARIEPLFEQSVFSRQLSVF